MKLNTFSIDFKVPISDKVLYTSYDFDFFFSKTPVKISSSSYVTYWLASMLRLSCGLMVGVKEINKNCTTRISHAFWCYKPLSVSYFKLFDIMFQDAGKENFKIICFNKKLF
jgi:hypothetical protein